MSEDARQEWLEAQKRLRAHDPVQELKEALIAIRDHDKRLIALEARVTRLEGYGIKGTVGDDGKITWDDKGPKAR